MASIFGNAYLTISASSAKNCHEGLDINSLISNPENKHFYIDPTGPPALCFQGPANHGASVRTALFNSSTLRRSWVFQETLLSRRIVHFFNGAILWQCYTKLESEDATFLLTHDAGDSYFQFGSAFARGPLASFAPSETQTWDGLAWFTWLEGYFSREFIYPEESIPALVGVIRLWQHLTGDDPVVGMWKENLQLYFS